MLCELIFETHVFPCNDQVDNTIIFLDIHPELGPNWIEQRIDRGTLAKQLQFVWEINMLKYSIDSATNFCVKFFFVDGSPLHICQPGEVQNCNFSRRDFFFFILAAFILSFFLSYLMFSFFFFFVFFKLEWISQLGCHTETIAYKYGCCLSQSKVIFIDKAILINCHRVDSPFLCYSSCLFIIFFFDYSFKIETNQK